jgi:hypothetical protein
MEKNRGGALCCGGGAGNFEIDLLGGSETSPARRRVREAAATGASVLAVACQPFVWSSGLSESQTGRRSSVRFAWEGALGGAVT